MRSAKLWRTTRTSPVRLDWIAGHFRRSAPHRDRHECSVSISDRLELDLPSGLDCHAAGGVRPGLPRRFGLACVARAPPPAAFDVVPDYRGRGSFDFAQDRSASPVKPGLVEWHLLETHAAQEPA